MTTQRGTREDMADEISRLKKRIGELEATAAEYQEAAALKARECEALSLSEEKYRYLIYNTREAIFIIQDGVIVFLNRMEVSTIGYSSSEMSGKPLTTYIHPHDQAMVADRYIRRMKGEKLPERYSFRLVHRDGPIRWVAINPSLIVWDEKPAVLCMMIDITERVRAEEELRTSEARYRLITEKMNDIIWTSDLELQVTYISPSRVSLGM